MEIAQTIDNVWMSIILKEIYQFQMEIKKRSTGWID